MADRVAARVVIVDDDVWIRRGRAAALAERPGIDVLADVSHSEALERPELWSETDVALVDAWDHRAGFDRFPGVAVVRAIRAHPRAGDITVIVVTGHVVNEMLRVRMSQAGADLLYGHDEVADPDRLAEAVTQPRPSTPPALDRPLPRVHPDAALDWIRDRGVAEAFDAETQKTIPLPRRAIAHIRKQVGTRGGLVPPGSLATWRQVVAFVNRARGAELRRPR
ncbi:MAG TPA: hypothetical protein VGR90_05810 [Acidimicrobiales bacterium]|nr:hypothetical protein [Acidimicrobiales bacterium]